MAINVNDFNLLIQWGFQLFEEFSSYKDEEDSTVAFNSLISQQQFQLITKLISKESEFSNQEVIELFQLGDKFLATGRTREKIFSLFVKQLSLKNVVSIHELQCLNLWNEFVNYLKCNWAIEIDGCTIKLDGLKVNPEKMEETFTLLRNLVKLYKVLYICDIPLSLKNLSVIHSDLIELHIENCPFNFEEQLNISELTRLTHFACLNCFADCHLRFTLESLPNNLKYLDISGNLLNPIDHSPLVDWIEKQKSLKYLNLSGNNLNPRSAPTLFNVLFNLPSLEVLNLAHNYLGCEFLKELSSFPGSLNWKSLTVNDFDELSKDSDLLAVCFSKLKQLEYLNISDAPDEITEQEFSSLCKGISELINLKKFIFNTKVDSKYSSKTENEIEKLFKKNPNLSLFLKDHAIKSLEDWKLSVSHASCSIVGWNEKIENFSQSFYRFAKIYLNSLNNEPSQIEYLINKIREVEGVKLSIVHFDYSTDDLEVFDNFLPQQIEFHIIYETEDDLKNILSYCKNYFKSISFHFQIAEDNGYPLYEFVRKHKNSHFWVSIEELELVSCELETALNIMAEINLSNLKHLHLKGFRSEVFLNEFDWLSVKNYSLQKLTLTLYREEIYGESLGILFRCFPNMTEFRIRSYENLSNDFSISTLPKGLSSYKDSSKDFSISALPKGLRSLDISRYGKMKSLDFLNDLSTFPLLTKLTILNHWERSSNLDLNMTIHLPNLTELTTQQWILNSAKFVLPKLRKLIIDQIYNSSLDNLKKFEKLKNIELLHVDRGIINKVIDSDFLFLFPNLSEFYCDEKGYCGGFTNGLESKKVSKSLVHFTVNDIQNIPYSCAVSNGVVYQSK